MNKIITRCLAVTAFGALGSTAALAHVDESEAGTQHWMTHVATTPGHDSFSVTNPFGYSAEKSPERTIDVTQARAGINVSQGETVRLVAGGKSVVWTFDTLRTGALPLSVILPGAGGMVYVDSDPLYRG